MARTKKSTSEATEKITKPTAKKSTKKTTVAKTVKVTEEPKIEAVIAEDIVAVEEVEVKHESCDKVQEECTTIVNEEKKVASTLKPIRKYKNDAKYIFGYTWNGMSF